ncbi:MAG: hypothetical protein LBE99_03750, partial [Puniceicoccales bacterium]|nr:hypothetical protein [Puniceicoccales bacterium]
MPDVASVTEPSTNVFQPESPEEPSGTGSKSSSNPLGGEGVVDWLEQLQNTFHQMGGKPILPNPQGLDSFEFYSPIAQKILEQIQQLKDSGVLDGYANLSNLDKDGLALLCMLFTQQSKSELIRGLQNALAAKVQERSATQKEFLDQQLKVLNDTIELQLAAEEQKKSALVKSIFGIIAAVFTAIVATVVTVASFGAAAGPAAVLLVVALS